MGRTNTPTSLKLLKGNPGKRPLPKDEPKPTAGSPRPHALKGEGLAEWKRIVKELTALKVISKVDRGVIQVAAQAWEDWQLARAAVKKHGFLIETAQGGFKSNPAAAALGQARTQYLAALRELGLTPAARSKVKALDSDSEKDSKKGGFDW